MTSRERLLAAINRKPIDRLAVTTHHILPYFLKKYMPGKKIIDFFDKYNADAIDWVYDYKAPESTDYYLNPAQKSEMEFLETRMISSDDWMIDQNIIEDKENFRRVEYTIKTPSGNLTTILESNEYTTWVAEHLVKKESDIDIIGKHVTFPACDVEAVNRAAENLGDRGIIRGHIPTFDLFGQPGCWQDACCLFGVEKMIMATFDDPEWVHTFLGILRDRKIRYVETLKGAAYDIHELGGGDASTTIISPHIFRDFVAPYDSAIIEAVHKVNQKVVYHTCGGMMPILEDIADMGPDAMETFTPIGMGGDTDLVEAKKRIGNRVCMIGGFDQGLYFDRATPSETRKAVRNCFEQAGTGGGFILAPSDHFFDAKPELLEAFFDESLKCIY